MRLKITLFSLLASSLLMTACSGISEEERLRLEMLRQEQARAAAEAAQKEAAAREERVQFRLKNALSAWNNKETISEDGVAVLFQSRDARFAAQANGQTLDQSKIYYTRYPLQALRYNYKKQYQPLNIVGIRNLPNSQVYSPLFPDSSAQYRPGHTAKSVLEFVLTQDTEKNRMGQDVLMAGGHRWVATTLNFKDLDDLKNMNTFSMSWIQGVFEDIRWEQKPEVTHQFTKNRQLEIQLGFRFCTLTDRCFMDLDYRGNPTHAVRAEVMSILIVDGATQKVLGKFINEAK